MRKVKLVSDILRITGVVLLLAGLVLTLYAGTMGAAPWGDFKGGLRTAGISPGLGDQVRFNSGYFAALAGARQDDRQPNLTRSGNAASHFEHFRKRALQAEEQGRQAQVALMEQAFDTELDLPALTARFEQRDSLREQTEIREMMEYMDDLAVPALKSGKVLPKLRPASLRPWFEERHALWLEEHGEKAGSFAQFLEVFKGLMAQQGDVTDPKAFAEAVDFDAYHAALQNILAQEREEAAETFLESLVETTGAWAEGGQTSLVPFLREQYQGMSSYFPEDSLPPYDVFLSAVQAALQTPGFDGSYSYLAAQMRSQMTAREEGGFEGFLRGFSQDIVAESDGRKAVPLAVPAWRMASNTLWFWVAGIGLIVLSFLLARVANAAILKRREYKGVEDDPDVLLRVRNLRQYFKSGDFVNKAVDDVSFYIKKGEVFGLVGESGCGKTTTGRTIINLYDPTGGDVYFQGLRISSTKNGAPVMLYQLRKELAQKIAAVKARCERAKKQEPGNAHALEAACKEEVDALQQAHRQEVERIHAHAFESEEEKRKCVMLYREQRKAALTQQFEQDMQALTGQAREERAKRHRADLEIAAQDNVMTRIQMIFQDPIASINPRMTVREIIAEGLTIRGVKDKELVDQKVYEMLDLVGLVPEHADRYPHEFSGGQRQRIGIARAIVLEPDLIIADEPISALDVSIQAQIINLLNDLRKKMGLTIMFIAHNLSVVKYFSDRIAVMYFGRIVEMAPSEELFRNPLHPYTRSLLSAIPYPDPQYEKHRVRVTYEPVLAHDYSTDKPSMHEITPGHFIHANQQELEKYRGELNL